MTGMRRKHLLRSHWRICPGFYKCHPSNREFRNKLFGEYTGRPASITPLFYYLRRDGDTWLINAYGGSQLQLGIDRKKP
jgi:hypothetical protein